MRPRSSLIATMALAAIAAMPNLGQQRSASPAPGPATRREERKPHRCSAADFERLEAAEKRREARCARNLRNVAGGVAR